MDRYERIRTIPRVNQTRLSTTRMSIWSSVASPIHHLAISFGWVFWKVFIKKEYPKIVALPFIPNLFFNVIFTPIQFGLENLTLALIDIWLVLATIVWMTWIIKPYNKYIAWAQLPYLAWVSFATVLQFAVFWLN